MATEGTNDTVKALSSLLENLGNLAAAPIIAVDNSLQTLMPSIETTGKTVGELFERSAKTLNDSVENLSTPLNSIVASLGELATSGIKAVSATGWQVAETVGYVGNNVLSAVQSAAGTIGDTVTSILPVGKKI